MVKLLIDSLDKYDERTVEEVLAIKSEDEEKITYTYSSELGENTINIFKDFSVEIIRKGQVESYQMLKEGENTKFLYKTPYFLGNFEIRTEKVKYEEKKLTICYFIYDNDIEMNKLTIEIKELDNKI
ncbi:DUF1934 domain-containing protein [Cetobacterium sp. 2A]|uniref:DUF1934 domain-containing protein n=1 Tax=Cetobacterium sp. 2A TaxID=2754723 RepID=UPI00163BDA5B|nr:DUF1934 domain-containing protein [Cetobacterium sp. 2A]MBC2855787.1 DUF1934 domain-containing protein [Cetobacterium sp. 2A]